MLVRTTALLYNTAGGATVENGNSITITQDNTFVIGLQIKCTYASSTKALKVNNPGCFLQNCILVNGVNNQIGSGTLTLDNCLLQTSNSTTLAGGRLSLFNCTLVNTAGTPAGTAIAPGYNNLAKVVNCAVFGFTTFADKTLIAGSDYNATDLSSAGAGTHNQTSLTFASQFVSSTTDFRAVNTGSLKNGTPDSTNAPLDISGQTRDATTPYIGCWEVAAAAGGVTYPQLERFTRGMMRGNWGG